MQSQFYECVGAKMMSLALNILEYRGHVNFECFFVSEEQDVVPLHVEPVNDQTKASLSVILRKMAPECAAIVIMSETWLLEDSEAVNSQNASISEHQERKEGVFVHVASPLGDLLFTTTFERDSTGKPIQPTEVESTWEPNLININHAGFKGLFTSTEDFETESTETESTVLVKHVCPSSSSDPQ